MYLGGVGGDLLCQRVLDGVEVVVHGVVCGDDAAGGDLVLGGQGVHGV